MPKAKDDRDTRSPDQPAIRYGRFDPARYQQLRLRLGVVGIGAILVGSWIALALSLPNILDGLVGNLNGLGGCVAAALLGLTVALVQGPIDIMARRLEVSYGQSQQSTRAFGKRYFWSSLAAFASLTLAGGIVGLLIWAWTGDWIVPAVGGLLILAFMRLGANRPAPAVASLDAGQLAWAGEVRRELEKLGLSWPPIAWYDHGERSLNGGWRGIGPLKVLFLSKSLTQTDPRVAASLIARELGHARLKHRIMSVTATLVWIGLGVAVARLLEPWAYGPHAPTTSGLLTYLALVLTNWYFVGLFLWPALGRHQVLAADRFAKRCGLSHADCEAMFDALAQHNQPDQRLSRVKRYVFHPIPPLAERRASLMKYKSSELGAN
jgi:Zn-dependent protease with chaperone function